MKRNDPISEEFEEYLIKRASYGNNVLQKFPKNINIRSSNTHCFRTAL